jgi:hypothetical protein
VTLLRNLLSDLVDRRLWPIALLLAIAAVAIPVVLGSGGEGATDAPAAPLPADAVASPVPAVEVVGPAAVRSRAGKVRDPFRRSAKGAAARATDDGAPAPRSSSSGSKAASTSSAGADGTPAEVPATTTARTTATGAGGVSAAAAASGPSVYRTRVRWGQDAKSGVHGVARLQPLGGVTNPALLYLGTTRAGTRAIFLLGPNASAEGDGTCAEKSCRVVRLKAGDKTVVSVQGEEGSTVGRYTLVVARIARQAAGSEDAAVKLRARVHHDGRDALRAMIKDAKTAAAIGQFRFDRSLGAVVATSGA